MSKFSIGKLVATRRISERIGKDPAFGAFISEIIKRYERCDWGDLPNQDKRMNSKAVKCGGRILAAYIYSDSKSAEVIWIITESDRSVTTVLFRSEY